MPIYEYECKNCGIKVEYLQKVTDSPKTLCPECQAATLTKLISPAAFRLKGSGWYETDFKGEKDKKRNLLEDNTAGNGAEQACSKPKTSASNEVQKENKKDAGSATAANATNTTAANATNTKDTNTKNTNTKDKAATSTATTTNNTAQAGK